MLRKRLRRRLFCRWKRLVRSALPAPLPFPLDGSFVGVKIHLDGVPLRRNVALCDLRILFLDGRPHRGPGRKAGIAFEQIGHPLTLRLGQRHDGAQRLDEADEIQIRMLRRDDVQVGRQAVGFGLEKIPVEEGKGDVVAGRKDDDIDSGLGPIDEASPVAGEAFEVGANVDLAVADEVEQVVGDSRVFGAEGVVGRGSTRAVRLSAPSASLGEA